MDESCCCSRPSKLAQGDSHKKMQFLDGSISLLQMWATIKDILRRICSRLQPVRKTIDKARHEE